MSQSLKRWYQTRQLAVTPREVTRATQLDQSSVPVVVDVEGEPVEVDVSVPEAIGSGVRAGAVAQEALEHADGAAADALQAALDAAEAKGEAEATRFLAEGLFQVIPSTSAPTTSPTGALKQGDQWWKIGTGDTDGKFVGVAVWDGTQWQDRQLVADSLLVPGSVGAILIGDGQITAPKLSVDALDFKTARGMSIYGTHIEGGQFALADSSGFGQIAYDDCETTFGRDVFPVSSRTMSTNTNHGTRSVELTNYIHIFWNLRTFLSTDSYFEISVWSSKPSFVFSLSGIPSMSGVTINVTPNTWTNLTIPVTEAGDIWEYAITPSDFNDSGTIRISRVAVYGPFEIMSGLTIGRDESGRAVLETTVEEHYARMTGGGIVFGDTEGVTASLSSEDGGLRVSGPLVSEGMGSVGPQRALLNHGGLLFNHPLQGGAASLFLGPGLIENQTSATELHISGAGGSNSDVRISVSDFPGSYSKIILDGPVQFQGDTDWAEVSVPDATGYCRWRRLGGIIYCQFNVTFNSPLASNGAKDPMATLPSEAAPVGNTPINIIGLGSRPVSGMVNVLGGIVFRNTHTASVSTFFGGGNWPAND